MAQMKHSEQATTAYTAQSYTAQYSNGDLEVDMRPVVVSLEADLFVATRLDDVVTAQGGRSILVETPAAFADALDQYFPVLALVDLKTPGDWETAIRRSKMRPHTRQIPIYAFGSHVDVQTLQRARKAGADHAWANSKMMAELVDVVGRHIDPPRRYPAGWDDELSDLARQGLEEFNRGEYFEQHEHLEEAWMAETRPIRAMYQGVLQVGVAFLQIEANNWAGALKMFRRGLPKLRALPDVCQTINIADFRAAAERIHAEITVLGPERLAEFDQSRFPQIEYDAQGSEESAKTAK